MNDRERLKSMIAPCNGGGSWFVSHFEPGGRDTWHPFFAQFMDLRHRLNADAYPCKYFRFCLLDGFNWAEGVPFQQCPTWDMWKNCPDELKGMKIGGGDFDCEPITAGQYAEDEGPTAEANRATWRKFIERHRHDKTNLTRAADEVQPAIEYYITHNDFIGRSILEKQHPELDEPTPLPAWLVGVVTHEPAPWGWWKRPSGQERLRQEHEAEIERVTKINAARGLDNEGRPLKRNNPGNTPTP